MALPDHQAPPGAVLVAGVDEQGVEYVLEDDPHALPMVDPRYDVDDKNWVRYRTSWGGFLRLVIFVLAIIWVVTTARGRIYGWVDAQIEPGGEPGDPIELTIPSGASTNNVATLLENEGVISNATVFRYWLRCEGELSITGFLGCDAERTFQAGDYEIPTNLALADAVAVLDQGPIPEIFVDFTIPEGLRLSELVERLLAVNSNFDRADLLDALRIPVLSRRTPTRPCRPTSVSKARSSRRPTTLRKRTSPTRPGSFSEWPTPSTSATRTSSARWAATRRSSNSASPTTR